MSTINPNQGITGSDKTSGDVIATPIDPANPELAGRAAAQMQDFQQFLFLQNEKGTDGSTMEATDQPGEYLLKTGDGEEFKVINTDEIELDPEVPVEIKEGGNPNLALGGAKDIDIEGSDQDNKIMGNLGDNVIDGGRGDDLIGGGAGDDTLRGGEDDDTLMGGEGDDLLKGGAGDDTFAYPDDTPPDGEGDDESEQNADYHYGNDVISDFGKDGDDDTLLLGDFNNDGVFDSKDYTVENYQTEDGASGALITFIGPDGSRGSVFLKDIDASKLNFSFQGDTGQVKLSGDTPETQERDLENQDDEDDPDDDLFFTIL